MGHSDVREQLPHISKQLRLSTCSFLVGRRKMFFARESAVPAFDSLVVLRGPTLAYNRENDVLISSNGVRLGRLPLNVRRRDVVSQSVRDAVVADLLTERFDELCLVLVCRVANARPDPVCVEVLAHRRLRVENEQNAPLKERLLTDRLTQDEVDDRFYRECWIDEGQTDLDRTVRNKLMEASQDVENLRASSGGDEDVADHQEVMICRETVKKTNKKDVLQSVGDPDASILLCVSIRLGQVCDLRRLPDMRKGPVDLIYS